MFGTKIKIPFRGLRYFLPLSLCFLYCQGDPATDPLAFQPRFAAIVVANLDATSSWYQALLKLSVKSQQTGSGYRVTILTSPVYELELLELSGSLARDPLLAGHPPGTQIQGLFKTGFEVTSMDSWISHLQGLNISIPQIYTDATTGKRNFLITDPEGNLVQFFEN
jgi:catechol-2,3-dioxygenase